MKKLLLTALAATLISMCAFAQSDHGKKISWGVKGGVNLAYLAFFDTNFSLYESYSSKVKVSFYAGLFTELPISKTVSFQPEIVYSRQGNGYKDRGNKIWQRINYLNVPILVKINLVKWLSLDVGPQFGFLLNAKNKIELSNGLSGTFSSTSDYKKFDFSLAMGLTFRVSNHLDVSARYNLGLTDVTKRQFGGYNNSVTQIGAGYRF